ncbi:DUF2971 domain-containing protein [Terasakiella sp.]|uniref:DUF2971 domain-containing protein n=1 Tax=Terasakiella sp. TaxID=2034861 RepID=UPI003AA7E424
MRKVAHDGRFPVTGTNNKFDNGEYIYRYRPINSEHLISEIQNNELYFPDRSSLNDPMEGQVRLNFHGDEIIWTNFLNNYALSVLWCAHVFAIDGQNPNFDKRFVRPDLTVEKLPTKEFQDLYYEFLNLLKEDEDYIEAKKGLHTRGSVTDIELRIHFRALHSAFTNILWALFYEKGLINHRSSTRNIRDFLPDGIEKHNLYETLNALEAEHPENHHKFKEALFAVQRQMFEELRVRSIYNIHIEHGKPHQAFSTMNVTFSDDYIDQLVATLYPDWSPVCFSRNCTNASMWGHYASGHQGICLQFKPTKNEGREYINFKNGTSIEVSDVEYGEAYPALNYFEHIGSSISVHDLIEYWLTKDGKRSCVYSKYFDNEDQWRDLYWKRFQQLSNFKFKDWKYENECRTIRRVMSDKDRLWNYNQQHLTGIVFGMHTPDDKVIEIIKAIAEKHYDGTLGEFSFYKANFSSQGNSMQIMEFQNMTKFAPKDK